jgi:hypothetical protein
MKIFLTTLILLTSIVSFGQADTKFDIIMKSNSINKPFTNVVDYDKPDTCYIHVITNDEITIETMKNTYLLDGYEVKNGRHTFYFPKKSGARILTNLYGSKVDFTVHKVICH